MNPLRGDLVVREDKAGRVFVDAEETIVESYEDAMAVLEKGQASRQVGETKMNARSSRSHTIFTLQIESKGGDGVDQSFRASSLNLVDLAGSERLKSTGAEGARQKEGSHINKSLLVLGTIINRLSSANGDPAKYGHLPYRDSKLTRLLRPALGGNAKTAIMCAVTPSASHGEETVSTLKFAERAKKVTNSAVRNEVVDYRSKYKEAATELALLREQYNTMETELVELRNGKARGEGNSHSASSSFTEMSGPTGRLDMSTVQLNSGVEAANAIAVSVELEASKEEVKYLKEHVDEVETENEHLRAQLRKKAAEFRGLRQRALELRASSRRARHSERAVRRALALSYKKLEEARQQLEISRKKGAHVKKAEGYLEDLSKSLQSWLPGSSNALDELVSTDALADLGSEGRERRESNVSELSVITDARGVSTARLDTDNMDNVNEGITLNGQRSVRSVSRRPRPLPEDMVAEIDDSEAETDHSIPVDVIGDDETDSEGDHHKLAMITSEVSVRISDDSRDTSSAEKPKKKPKGWKAFKNFYGYGYTQRGVYDRMIGGHKVPSTATNIST
ncbi:Kinesin-related Protein [Gracilaria domingensis]|nr:Kinesin-related Protein [Gracilaria domingensis]